MTLTQAALPARSTRTNILLVLAGSALVALSAQASVPMWPVPMTLQTLAITLIGLTYGSRLAAATMLAYLAEGAVGLPVFANASGGIAPLMGPTAGFLWGFVGMAWLTGWLVERGLDRGFLRLFVAGLVPGLMLFVPGALALSLVLGKSLSEAAALEIAQGAPVIVYEGLSFSEGTPIAHFISVFPKATVPGLAATLGEVTSVTEALVRNGIDDYVRAETRISVDHASATQAIHLRIGSGDAVLKSVGINRTEGGLPIEYGTTWFAGDKVTLTVAPDS